jgi:hypothetical protein
VSFAWPVSSFIYPRCRACLERVFYTENLLFGTGLQGSGVWAGACIGCSNDRTSNSNLFNVAATIGGPKERIILAHASSAPTVDGGGLSGSVPHGGLPESRPFWVSVSPTDTLFWPNQPNRILPKLATWVTAVANRNLPQNICLMPRASKVRRIQSHHRSHIIWLCVQRERTDAGVLQGSPETGPCVQLSYRAAEVGVWRLAGTTPHCVRVMLMGHITSAGARPHRGCRTTRRWRWWRGPACCCRCFS